VVFVGKGLRALQEAGVVPIHALGGLRLDILGIFPTVETAGAQVVLILGLAASALWPTTGGNRPPLDRTAPSREGT